MTVLSGAAVAFPGVARSQSRKVPVVGFMHSASPGPAQTNLAVLRETLKQMGYVEGDNYTIEDRWAESDYDRLPAIAANLVSRGVSVIVSAGAAACTIAAKRATTTIPIVFAVGGDPIDAGLVPSLNSRAGNVTGATFFSAQLGPKRLELMRELLPHASSFALLLNPNNASNARNERALLEAVAGASRVRLRVIAASSEDELDGAFREASNQNIEGLIVSSEALFNSRIERMVAGAANARLPTIYFLREFIEAGGLISYGASITDNYRQVGAYVARILNGALPSELPVVLPTKFELAINMQTARALGISVPRALISFAHEVIE